MRHRPAQVHVGQRAVLRVHLDAEGAELRLQDAHDTRAVLQRVHVLAGQVDRDMGFAARQHQALRGGLAHDLPDRAIQVAARLPGLGDALELIQVALFGALDLEPARAGQVLAQVLLAVVCRLVGLDDHRVDDELPRQHRQEGGKGLEQLELDGLHVDGFDAVGIDHTGDHQALPLARRSVRRKE